MILLWPTLNLSLEVPFLGSVFGYGDAPRPEGLVSAKAEHPSNRGCSRRCKRAVSEFGGGFFFPPGAHYVNAPGFGPEAARWSLVLNHKKPELCLCLPLARTVSTQRGGRWRDPRASFRRPPPPGACGTNPAITQHLWTHRPLPGFALPQPGS